MKLNHRKLSSIIQFHGGVSNVGVRWSGSKLLVYTPERYDDDTLSKFLELIIKGSGGTSFVILHDTTDSTLLFRYNQSLLADRRIDWER